MKILHTSDWHLGQYFMMKTRELEHIAFFNWLIELIRVEAIDALIVAGDIFDSSAPPSYARKLYNDFIIMLRKTNCSKLIIVSGNHDSVAVLNENSQLLEELNVSVLAGLHKDINDHIIELKNNRGEIEAVVCALPFLRANDVMESSNKRSTDDQQLALQNGIANTYQDLYKLCKDLYKDVPLIATGHLTAVGCTVSDSVREIYIGTLTAFSSKLFPAFDYIALGHLHKAQKVHKNEHIRYCGSPIPLSFDEVKNNKQVLIANFNEEKLLDVEVFDIPLFQEFKIIKGDLNEVTCELKLLAKEYQNSSIWVEVKIKDPNYKADVTETLQACILESKVEILKVSRAQINENQQWILGDHSTLDDLTPIDVFKHRLDETDELDKDQKLLMETLFNKVCSDLKEQA